MNEKYGRFFGAMHQFRRLKIGELFPEMSKSDGLLLMSIAHFEKTHEGDKLTVSELACMSHMQASAVSRTLKSLEDQNLIERTVNKSDRRNTYIMLTEAGGQKRKEIEQRMEEFSKAVFERLDDDDMERLISYLDKLYQVAEEEIEHFAENKSKTQ